MGAEEATLNATANSTENETDWATRALTEEDVTEFIKSADKDKNDKVNLEEVNKLFQFDIDDEQFKKEFQGIEADDMALLLEQKGNMTNMFTEADADKDGHLTKDEIFNSAGLKSFLQTAVNDEYGDDGEYGDDMEGGEGMEGGDDMEGEYGDEDDMGGEGEYGDEGEMEEGDMGEEDGAHDEEGHDNAGGASKSA